MIRVWRVVWPYVRTLLGFLLGVLCAGAFGLLFLHPAIQYWTALGFPQLLTSLVAGGAFIALLAYIFWLKDFRERR